MGDLAKDIQSTFPSEKVKALINIKYTSNWLDSMHNEFLKPFKITIQQFNVLRILRGAKKKVTVNYVKERMVERAPNATRLMDKLCNKGLIGRTRCDMDRRVVYVEITKHGLNVLNRIDDVDVHLDMEKITEKEAKILNEILDKIR